MLSKSKTTKALLYSTAALSLFAASHVHADETSHWTARSVDQIKADISVNDNQQTYTDVYKRQSFSFNLGQFDQIWEDYLAH